MQICITCINYHYDYYYNQILNILLNLKALIEFPSFIIRPRPFILNSPLS